MAANNPCPTCTGPGYASPADAINGPREKILYVTGVHTGDKPDAIFTVDVDAGSVDYCKILHKLELPNVGDELHHFGWNSCSSDFANKTARRTHLIFPCLHSNRIYIVDVATDPVNPRIHKIIEPEEMLKQDVSFPHTTHCLPNGCVLISTLGDAKGNAKGSFVVVDCSTFEIKGLWNADHQTSFGYDFWYQPRLNVMISSEWGEPKSIKNGFSVDDVAGGKYGSSLHVWDWKDRKHLQEINLGADGCMALEVRMFHNPEASHGFVGCALGSAIFHFHKDAIHTTNSFN